MKPALKVLLTAVVALALGVWVFGSWRRSSQQLEARLAREHLKREFLERSFAARELSGEQAKEWREEVRGLARWYADELAAVRSRFPAGLAAPAEAARAAREREKDKEGARAEWQRYAEERFRLLTEGRYEPLASAADHGLHLDLLSLEPAQNPVGGGRAVKVEFALWGAPRRFERDVAPGGGRATLHTVVGLAFKQLDVQILDEKGKTYAEMSGPGEPYQKLGDPERFIEEFPPGILFGTWYLDALPREAARLVLTVPVESHGQAGASAAASFRFDLPVAESWRIAPGEVYQAETREGPR
ncbi:MAG TPA: hypothetical protein VMK42_15135 [Anaeromyxobacteraceae bacterium]|nr:hypothetical protein [Anaeromyxobacteraceae bacterium]